MACPLVLPTIAPELDFVTKEKQSCRPEGDPGGLLWSDLGGDAEGKSTLWGQKMGIFWSKTLGMTPRSSEPWFPHSQGAAVPNESQSCPISHPIRPQRVQALRPLMSAL